VTVCSMDDDPRYEAYNNDRIGNPAYPLSFGTITEEPGGAQFEELVVDLLTRYPATPREVAEAALRSVWETHALSWRCLQLAEASLADEHQWPAVRPTENGLDQQRRPTSASGATAKNSRRAQLVRSAS
jgi:hypothetical protein